MNDQDRRRATDNIKARKEYFKGVMRPELQITLVIAAIFTALAALGCLVVVLINVI